METSGAIEDDEDDDAAEVEGRTFIVMYKWVVDKCNAAVLVVYANVEFIRTCTSSMI